VINKNGKAVPSLPVTLGDRANIKRIVIEKAEVVVQFLTQGPDDALCCPTQAVTRRFAYAHGMLVRVGDDLSPPLTGQ
jgi:hypothetical protein